MFAKVALLLCAVISASGFSLGGNDIAFHLFSQANPTISEPLLPTVDSIMTSRFSLSRRTIFTIHSHGEGVAGNFNAFVVPAHLAISDANVIAVDWSRGASLYSIGLGNAPQVGRVIADFINIIVHTFGYNINQIRIVGVGLGGHIAGIAARTANGVIPHVVALDPSFHGWTHHPEILKPGDATAVEVIHTTAGIIGYDYPLGTVDFYPNGGSQQNGCGFDPDCSHTYAIAFYAESLTSEVNGGNAFIGTACENYEQAITMQCSGNRNAIFGGSETKSSESGIYTFTTNFAPPFARG